MSPGERLSRGFEPVTAGEWLMVALAAVDVLLLFIARAYEAFLPAFVGRWVIPIDLAIVVLFALELGVRLIRADRKVAYLRNHWYDVVGLLPAASVTLRSLRLLRLVRIYVVKTQDWAEEADWMRAFVRGVVRRYLDVLLQELTAPIMYAGVKMVKAPLKRAKFARLMGNVLDTQRRQVHAVVDVTLRNTKGVKGVAGTKAGRKLTEAVTEAVMDTVVDTLRSEEMNLLIANATEDVLSEVTEQMTGAKPATAEAIEAAGPQARAA